MTLPELFRTYLLSRKGLSPITAKNYTSDIRRFMSWYENNFKKEFTPENLNIDVINFFIKTEGGLITTQDSQIGSSQQAIEKTSSTRSFERYLSSLRKLAEYLTEEKIISKNPFLEVSMANSNSETEDAWDLKGFKDHLYTTGASKLTIKNYMVDINAFTTWAESSLSLKSLTAKEAVARLTPSSIEEYKTRLVSILNLSPLSVNRKLSTLRRYLAYAQQEGLIENYDFGISNESDEKENEQTSGLSLDDLNNESNTSSQKQKYSSFAPFRLGQKILAPYAILEDKIAGGIASKIKHKNLEEKAKKGRHNLIDSLKFKLRNYPKEYYAPHAVSLAGLPLHKKIIHHARYTRPQWYKRYHNNAVTHYFHFAILVIYASIVGFIIYTSLFLDIKGQNALAAPTAPPRILSFQGRLTDANDNPITTATDIRFQVYDDSAATGAGNLLWQEVIEVSPDQDGIFSELLGNGSACLSQPLAVQQTRCAFPADLFTDNATLYLGITIESTSELSPRQRLAAVAYAANAEALQGMLPITDVSAGTTNVVLALDSSGDLTIGGSATPTFQATGGQFAVTGQTLLLSTNTSSNGNVQIAPDGLGKIDVQKPLVNSTATGNITPGGVEINDKFGVLATESAVAAFVVNNNTTGGDIFTASSSGTTRFTIENDGDLRLMAGAAVDTITTGTLSIGGTTATTLSIGRSGQGITLPGFTGQNGVLYGTSGTGVVAQATTASTGLCLLSGASNPAWGACGGSSNWDVANGTIAPKLATTVDLLIGGTSTSSAKFSVLNINSGTPTASVSATGVTDRPGVSIAGNGQIQSLNNGTLTIGGTTTGNIIISPLNGGAGSSLTVNTVSAILAGTTSLTASSLATITSAATLGISATTLNLGAGAAATIGTVSDDDLTITPNGTGELTLTSDFNSGVNIGTSGNTPAPLSISGGIGNNAALIVNNTNNGNLFAASASGVTNFIIENDGDIIVGPGGTGKITAAIIDPYLVQNQYTVGNTELTFQTMAASNGDFIFQNQSTELATLFQAGLLHLEVNGSAAGLQIGDDTQIYRGAANRLDVATGDSVNLVSGDLAFGGVTTIDSSRNGTFQNVVVSGTCSGCISVGNISPFQELLGAIVPNNSTVDFLIGGQATASADFAVLNVNGTGPATASVSGNLTVMPKNGAGGNVGIGTDSPTQRLHIMGNIRLGPPSASAGIYLDGFTAATTNPTISVNSGNTMIFRRPGTGADTTVTAYQFAESNGTSMMVIKQGGNVGIGTGTSPTALLDVGGTASVSGGLKLYGTPTLQSTANQTLTFGGDTTGNISLMPRSGSGRVGINTASPLAILNSLGTTEQLRLSYDASNYSSFTTSSGGDLTVAPTGGDSNITGTLDVSGHVAVGGSASVLTTTALNVTETFNDTTSLVGLNNDITLSLSGDYTSTAFGIDNDFTISGTGNQNTGRVGGYSNITTINNVGTTSNVVGFENVVSLSTSAGDATIARAMYTRIDNSSSSTIATGIGLDVANPITSGLITNLYGIYVRNLTDGGSNNIGLRIDEPSGATNNYSLYLAGTGGTAASGIQFGTDTNLYRSAASTLRTDDAFNVNGNLNITSAGAISAATGITSSGTITFSGFTGANDGGIIYANASGVLSQTGAGTAAQCLIGGTTPSFSSCPGGTTDVYWNQANGTLFPNNSTVDFLIGGQASTSAKFAVLNVNSGTPTASVSAGTNGGSFLTASGFLSTTARQSLTIGNSSTFNTTGNVVINPNGTGLVGIGTDSPTTQLTIQGSDPMVRLLAPTGTLAVDSDSSPGIVMTANANSGITTYLGSEAVTGVYTSASSAGSYPFNEAGNLILQSRGSGAVRDIVFATGNAPADVIFRFPFTLNASSVRSVLAAER